jgi:hypothetical protein
LALASLSAAALSPSVVAGCFAGKGGEVPSLRDAVWQTHRVLKGEIAGREVSALSLMPAIFGEVLTPADFRDLVGWHMAP